MFIHSLICYVICMCALEEVKSNFPGISLSFRHAGPRAELRSSGFGSKHLYLMNHLVASPALRDF